MQVWFTAAELIKFDLRPSKLRGKRRTRRCAKGIVFASGKAFGEARGLHNPEGNACCLSRQSIALERQQIVVSRVVNSRRRQRRIRALEVWGQNMPEGTVHNTNTERTANTSLTALSLS